MKGVLPGVFCRQAKARVHQNRVRIAKDMHKACIRKFALLHLCRMHAIYYITYDRVQWCCTWMHPYTVSSIPTS